MRAVAPLLCLAAAAGATYVPIADETGAYPLLRRVGSLAPLRWDVGELAALRLGAAAVRVSSRGARFISPGAHLTWFEGWNHSACPAAPGALCRTPGNTTLFPEHTESVSIPGSAARVGDPFAAGIATRGCARHAARRISDTSAYTVSLCDVTQKDLHFLLVGDTVYVRERDEKLWFYLVVSAATIVVVTSVAQNIAQLLGGARETAGTRLELAAALLLPAVAWYGTAFVTVGDVVFFFATIAYVALHVVLHAVYSCTGDARFAVPVNVLLGALMLTLCRVYDGAESEYLGPVLLLFLARTFQKAHRVLETPLYTGGWRPVDHTTDADAVPALAAEGHEWLFLASQLAVLADFLLAGLAHQYGFRPLFARGTTGDAFFVVLFLVAYELSVLVRPAAHI
jgi:hypothetical protein